MPPSPSPARGLPGIEAVQANGTARPGRGPAFSAAEEPREGAELTPGAAGDEDGDRERDGQGSPDQQVVGGGPPVSTGFHTPPPVREPASPTDQAADRIRQALAGVINAAQ